jgi:hypothetical protein
MIDVLYNKLAAAKDISQVEWKDVSESIFNKHAQHSQHSNTKVIVEEQVLPRQSQQSPQSPPQPIILVDTNAIQDDSKDVKPLKQLKQPMQPMISLQTPKSISKKKEKDTTIKPLEIIISETSSFNNSTSYVKEALVAMISKEEFAKIFGATKCAEMMSGIVNNRWNKSTALFISFLLDKEICYNDKVMLYNKEKNKGRITIAKNV